MITLLSDGIPHSGYYIFLRCAGRYSDAELLDRFGLSTYRRWIEWQSPTRHVIIADEGGWTLIADDLCYTLWNMQATRPTLEGLGQECDVFACSVGDCDHSFDFVYYRDTQLVRKYIVTDPDFRSQIVVEDVGEPLHGEAEAFKEPDELSRVLRIATSLGIDIHYTQEAIRVYAPPNQQAR